MKLIIKAVASSMILYFEATFLFLSIGFFLFSSLIQVKGFIYVANFFRVFGLTEGY